MAEHESTNDLTQKQDITLKFHTQVGEDGITDLLKLSGQTTDEFRKVDLQNADEDSIIWGKEFTSESDERHKFKIGVRSKMFYGVHWVCGVIKNCSAILDHLDCLIHLTCRAEEVNYKGCGSYFLTPGRQCFAAVCRLDDLSSDVFKLKFTLHSLHISTADILAHQTALNYMEVSRPQGREKVWKLSVKWTLDDWRTSVNCTPGDKIHSKPFGDAAEQIIMCAVLCPNGDAIDPEGTLCVYLKLIHQSKLSRQTGMKINYKITVNDVAHKDSNIFTEGRAWGFNFGPHSQFNTKELNIVVELKVLV